VLVCGVYCVYSNSIFSKIILCCIVELIVFTATLDRVQCYCVVCGDFVDTRKVDTVQCY